MLIVVILAAACGSSGPARTATGKPAELRIAYQLIPNTALIVKHNRWLEKELGIPVRWIRFDSGASVNQAVASHDVDLGLAGTSSVATGVPAGLAYRVAWIYDVIGSGEALVVRKKEGITSLAELKGKRVAVPFGSTTHYALLAALTKQHLDPNKLDIVDLEPAQIVKAWRDNAIDAAYIWQPSLAKILGQGGQVLLDSAQLAKKGVLTGDLGIVSEEMASDFPAVVTAWLREESRAVDQYRSDPSSAAKAVGAELGIPESEALGEMKGYRFLTVREQLSSSYLGTTAAPGHLVQQLTAAAVFLSDFPQTAKFLKEYKLYQPKPTQADFDHVVDPSFLAKVE